jgi:hypothetical protein
MRESGRGGVMPLYQMPSAVQNTFAGYKPLSKNFGEG